MSAETVADTRVRAAFLAYSFLLYLLVPFVLLRLLWLGSRNPEYLRRWRERFGRPLRVNGDRPVLLLHAVSVGEVLAAKPLLHRLVARHPAYRIIITTTTPTGAMTVRQSFGESVEHLYFPYDLPAAVGCFLDRVRPDAVLVMETEIWPNFFAACRKRGVPLALVNARMSERSAAGYARVPGIIGDTLRIPVLIAAQSDADARRLRELGADPGRIVVCGNLKYDIRFPPSIREQGLALRRIFSASRPVWIAASTHEGEERVVLEAFATVRTEQPGCLLVLAPRHPERFDRVEALCGKAGFTTIRRTAQPARCDPEVDVYLLDTLGELPVLYASADVAFVGGSLTPHGGHNLLEPASLGLPLLSGPHLFNFADAAERLTEAGALHIVRDARELAATLLKMLGDANLRHEAGERARREYLKNQGSADLVMEGLRPMLSA
jgi:3-deoxy-D-manno-octulosonic-acid transferase